jgi:hypothetical protein
MNLTTDPTRQTVKITQIIVTNLECQEPIQKSSSLMISLKEFCPLTLSFTLAPAKALIMTLYVSNSCTDSLRLLEPGVGGFGGGISCEAVLPLVWLLGVRGMSRVPVLPLVWLLGVRGSKAGEGASALSGARTVGGGVFGRGGACAGS